MSERATNGENQSNYPIIIISPEVLEEATPYKVQVDKDLMRKLMLTAGVSESDINTLKVNIEDKPKNTSSKTYYGEYDPKERQINIFCGNIWHSYEHAMKTVNQIINKETHPTNEPFDMFLKTNRLPRYLTKQEPNRARWFADKLIKDGLTRFAVFVPAHEFKHAADNINNPHRVMLEELSTQVGVLIASNLYVYAVIDMYQTFTNHPLPDIVKILTPFLNFAFGLYSAREVGYIFSPLEARANKFGRNEKYNSTWAQVINVEPKVG